MAGTPGNVLVGVAQIYTAPANTPAPALATTGQVTPPATPWTEIGFTVDGLTFNVDGKTQQIMVEEQSTPVLIVPDTTDVTLAFELSEDTLQNAQIAYGRGILTITVPTASVPGSTELALSDALNTLAVCFTGNNSFGLGRIVYVPVVYSTGKVATKYLRAKAQRSYPATLTAVCAMSQITMIDGTAPVT